MNFRVDITVNFGIHPIESWLDVGGLKKRVLPSIKTEKTPLGTLDIDKTKYINFDIGLVHFKVFI